MGDSVIDYLIDKDCSDVIDKELSFLSFTASLDKKYELFCFDIYTSTTIAVPKFSTTIRSAYQSIIFTEPLVMFCCFHFPHASPYSFLLSSAIY